MTTYRTKSVTVEAVQWTGENAGEVNSFARWVNSDEIPVGWWVTNHGEFPPSEFERLYEPFHESTLDLEAIEARFKAMEHRLTERMWADMLGLIAEVKRLRATNLEAIESMLHDVLSDDLMDLVMRRLRRG